MGRKNINRGFKQLRVWNNSIELYILTCKILSKFPYETENELIQLIKSLQKFQFMFQHSNIPTFQYSKLTRYYPEEPYLITSARTLHK